MKKTNGLSEREKKIADKAYFYGLHDGRANFKWSKKSLYKWVGLDCAKSAKRKG